MTVFKKSALILIVFFTVFQGLVILSQTPSNGGVVIGIKGTVEIGRNGTTGWEKAETRQILNPGDSIRTQQDSGAVLSFNNGTHIKIGEKSEMIIPEWEEPGSEETNLDLLEGMLWAKVAEMEGSEEFKVTTPSGVCAVKGTEFAIVSEKMNGSTLTVLEGSASFGNEYGNVLVGPSQQSVARPGAPPTPPKVVDTKHWVEWTFDIRAMGMDLEVPMTGEDREELVRTRERLLDELSGDEDCKTRLELGRVLYDLGENDAAEKEFETCTGADETKWDAMYGTGLARLARGDVPAAIETFENLEGSVGDLAETHMGLAQMGLGLAHLKAGNTETAFGHFDKAHELYPGTEIPLIGMAEIYIRRGETDKAADYLEKALDFNPESHQALLRMAGVELSAGRLENAEETVLKARKLAPDSPRVHGVVARVYFFRSDFSAAREAAGKAIEMDEFNPAGHEIMARIYIMENKLRAAVSEALKTLAIDSGNPYANSSLAMVYYLHRNYEGAIIHWEKAIEADKDFVEARVRLAHLYNELEKKSLAAEAESLVRYVVMKHDNNDMAWSELGRALELQRKTGEAEEAYMKALELAPGKSLHMSRLSSLYTDLHKLDLALYFAIRAVAVQPGNPANQFALGRAYEAADNINAAQSAYLTALSLDPDYHLARYQLGIIYTGLGKSHDALTEMHSAALMEPRTITLAEYRGASRLYGYRATHNTEYFEGVHTGDDMGYKLNYRAVMTRNETNSHREINGDSKSVGGSLLLGFRKNSDSSFVAYGDFSTMKNGEPGTDTGMLANDPDDRDEFKTNRRDFSFRRRLSPKFFLTLRAGKAKSKIWEYRSDWVNFILQEEDFKYDVDEKEVKIEFKYSDNLDIALGGFSFDSDPHLRQFQIFLIGPPAPVELITAENFEQQRAYTNFNYRLNEKTDMVGGIEESSHNKYGSNKLARWGFNHRIGSRSQLRFISRERYKLSFYPRYQPTDNWTLLWEDDSFAGTETKHREANFETRLRDGSFFKLAAYESKDWDYGCSAGFTLVCDVRKARGYRLDYEKPIRRKTNIFFSYYQNNEKYALEGSANEGKVVPYSSTSEYNAGVYHFFNSRTVFKLIAERYGRIYTNSANTSTIDPFTLARAQLRYEPQIDRSYILTVRNMANREHKFKKDYPGPGITWELGYIKWF